MSDEKNIVVLKDEDGCDLRFLHIMTFEFENGLYLALTPENEIEGIKNGDVILLQITEDKDGNDSYIPIEDEKKLKRVWEEFENLYYDEEEE